MGTSHGCLAASKAAGSRLHTIAYSPPAKPMAVPTEGVKTSSTCERIECELFASESLPWLFEVVCGRLPRMTNREQA